MPRLILSFYLLVLLAVTAALSQTCIMRSVIWILQAATSPRHRPAFHSLPVGSTRPAGRAPRRLCYLPPAICDIVHVADA